jgi:dihydroorotate dehydrogenase (fumarate)
MDLSTTYLGLPLPHPLMPGASPLVNDPDMVRRLEDAGAAAIVMHSLFEEQLAAEQPAKKAFSDALSYFPGLEQFELRPEEYLEQLHRVKSAVDVPVIASLNGVTSGGWLAFGRLIEQAGADAVELNTYYLATDPEEGGRVVEERVLEMVESVKPKLGIPVAVKLAPFYSALAHFSRELDSAGADGLVLFNRLFQPDIDVDEQIVGRRLELSSPSELLLRLRWLAILSERLEASLAVSGGVHTAQDAIKAVMAGAHAVQMVSALLNAGPEHLRRVRQDMAEWLERHEYESLDQVRGSMSLNRCPDPMAYERANYMEILQSWRR